MGPGERAARRGPGRDVEEAVGREIRAATRGREAGGDGTGGGRENEAQGEEGGGGGVRHVGREEWKRIRDEE